MNIKFKVLLSALLLVLGVQVSFAQFTATGTVKDDAGEPLIGATIQVKGTTTGTVTDLDGGFSVEVPTNTATLVVSYTGYETQEVGITSANRTIDIVLATSAEQLAEVVVVGYGETSKEGLTGAVSSLKSDRLEQVPLASVEQTLQGNIAGLQSNLSNGQPGSQVEVRIRGQGSISASSEPLYVVDGVPLFNPGDGLTSQSETANVMASMNPNDIESVTVLKDASATAIYGSRAANGVILITTKSGKAGKPQVKFSAQVGFNDWAVSDSKNVRSLDAREYVDLFMDGELNRGTSIATAISRFNNNYPDPQTGRPAVDITPDGAGGYTVGEVRVDTDWFNELSRTGINQSYDMSVSGGNETLTYFASASYFDQESPIIGVGLDRYSTRANVSVQALPWLKLVNNLNVSRTYQSGPDDDTAFSNPIYTMYLLPAVIPTKDAQGLSYDGHKGFFMGGNNPVGSLSGDDDLYWILNRIVDNVSAEVTLAKGLKFKSNWAIDLYGYNEVYYRNARYGDGRNSNGFAQETTRNITNWLGSQTLNYNKTFAEVHNFSALAGYEANKVTTRSSFVQGQNFPPSPQLRTIENAAEIVGGTSSLTGFAFESYFGRISYNYDYKYYISASLRRDGSSRFGTENRFGNFWSLGASWRLDQEAFIQNIEAINELKLRSSYGITGNAEIGNFAWLPSVSFGIDYDGSPGGTFTNIGNTNLTWEQSAAFNVGVDFRVFDRVSGVVEYFWRESDNLLLNLPVSRTTGFTSATQNFGAMVNKGIELTLDVDLVNTGDFSWTAGGNISFIENEITRLAEPFVDGTGNRFRREEGREYNEYWVYDYAGVNPDNGLPLWYTDETREATTSVLAQAQRFYIGKSGTPDFFGGFNSNLSWKGLTLDANFSFTWNNYLYDATAWVTQGDGAFTPRSQTSRVLDRWKKPGDITDVPKFRWGGNSNSNTQGQSRHIYDGTFIRLRNVTLAYQMPSATVKKLGLASARVYARGINFWTWTRDPDLGVDPETAINGYLGSPVPNMKTLSFGIDVGF
ncbi:MAG: TonB-dependent receptor [Saprospiraceae bacterium]|nr:TonB-dependent receptor [Saprospiraceae bacterium]